ncbi:MAG TPA: ABC transporter ATP-binding protein [Burkholderiales bacterium]|jgi:branched-chain amino acid transport system ATP-binding protein|nr:ABC transporter ATP-binding protein [Burkholderiales bacterium]
MSPANEVIPPPLLQAQALSKHFGGTAALKDVSFSAAPGEIVGLIGPNGAGKTTLLNLLSGVLRPTTGRVLFKGRDLAGLKAHAVARMGIARTLQTPRSFPSMSVLENVAVGAVFGRPHGHLDHAVRCLELVGLGARGDSPMSSLNLQERKSVEIARALAMAPSVVLIDEAMSGLNPTEIEDSMRLIRRVRDETGVTIIWVEHVVRAVMAVVERILVLNFGELIACGSPAEIARNGAVIEAYLGTAA